MPALELFPCDLLFIQRDTEKETFDKRLEEIKFGIDSATCELPKIIPVIPQRMSEAWLLIDRLAIRTASGNINGKMALALPNVNRLESLTDPKNSLISLIKKASGLNKRRLKKLNPYRAIHIVADTIDDYSPLRNLHSFKALEAEIKMLALESRIS